MLMCAAIQLDIELLQLVPEFYQPPGDFLLNLMVCVVVL